MGFMSNLFLGTWDDDDGDTTSTGSATNKNRPRGWGWHSAKIHDINCAHPGGKCNGATCMKVGAFGWLD